MSSRDLVDVSGSTCSFENSHAPGARNRLSAVARLSLLEGEGRGSAAEDGEGVLSSKGSYLRAGAGGSAAGFSLVVLPVGFVSQPSPMSIRNGLRGAPSGQGFSHSAFWAASRSRS